MWNQSYDNDGVLFAKVEFWVEISIFLILQGFILIVIFIIWTVVFSLSGRDCSTAVISTQMEYSSAGNSPDEDLDYEPIPEEV